MTEENGSVKVCLQMIQLMERHDSSTKERELYRWG